jgi:MerR family transcriptional regulator/heat shock protein HspR
MAGDGAGDRKGERGSTRRGGAPGPRRGVYMISVAAELAGMHPQTLRIYESRGLIEPERSPGNTRLYSQEDVERLRRIQELTTEMGMNLAGVERVFELELELESMRMRIDELQQSAERAERDLREEIERVRRSFKAELVPYQPPGSALIPARDATGERVRIPISRPTRGDGGSSST